MRKSHHPEIEAARQAPDRGDRKTFTLSVSQQGQTNPSWTLKPFRTWSDRPGRYGDPLGLVLKGVSLHLYVELSRFHEWTIRWGATPEDSDTLH
jgi:hypothetical protein